MKLTEDEAVVFCICVAVKAGRAAVMDGVLRLIIGEETLESPTAGALIDVGILDHHVDSATLTFEDDAVLLLRLAQFVNND